MAKNYAGENTLKSLTQIVQAELNKKADASQVASDIASAVESAKSDLDSKISTLTQTVETNKSEATSALNEAQTTLQGEIDDIKKTLGTSDDDETDGNDLVTRVSTLDDEVDELDERLTSAEGTISALESTYVKVADKGVAGGIAPLDESGQISSTYLPSYVDDVIDGKFGDEDDTSKFYKLITTDDNSADLTFETTAITPEKGKIYVDVTTSTSWRWTGTQFIKIVSDDLVEISNDRVQQIWNETVGSSDSTAPSTGII